MTNKKVKRHIRPSIVYTTALIGLTTFVLYPRPAIEQAEPMNIVTAPKQVINVVDPDIQTVNADCYTASMDVSFHEWEPDRKVASVIPASLIDMAEEHNISPVYAAAVFIHETGWGTSDAFVKKNNPAGITKGGKGYASYQTAEEGFERMFSLMENYYTNGLTTVAEQRDLWSTTDDTALIVDLMNQIR